MLEESMGSLLWTWDSELEFLAQEQEYGPFQVLAKLLVPLLVRALFNHDTHCLEAISGIN